MATNIVGSVSLSYGSHSHDESFTTTSTALSHTDPRRNYVAGGGRATATGAALEAGGVNASHEGLLLIKNTNTTGDLLVAMSGGDNYYHIQIPAETVNLVSVGTAGVVYVKTAASNQTSHGVDSVTTAGVITFDSAVTKAGTYIMYATAGGGGSGGSDHTSGGPHFIMKTTSDSSTTGTVFELDGTTKKDLNTGSIYGSSTAVTLNAIVDYRYTLTEA
tara:strand:+ start:415 stop:1068 length:654 start_codon:yes stop_codon:yes gene_type:complete